MQRTPASKKRKAEDDLAVSTTITARDDLVNMRAAVAKADPVALQQYVVTKFDNAIGSFDPKPTLHSVPLPTSPSVSPSLPPSFAVSSDTSSPSGTTSAPPTSSPTTTFTGTSSTDVAYINALSTIFSDVIDNNLLRHPSATVTDTGHASLPRSPRAPSSKMTGLSIPPTSVPSGAPANPSQEEEQHCARCHSDFLQSANRRDSCLIEHNLENCVRIAKHGHVSSMWEYECCGYQFESPYCDEPEDPNEDTDAGMYCFIGRHTTDEALAEETKMNTYTCQELGCWEEDATGSG
ncbi:hypothetical protein FRB99_007718 [Tulasnella sp. 403]|nr:hypothetical protein FRB99_007718 [Tulasnella sp. 403]